MYDQYSAWIVLLNGAEHRAQLLLSLLLTPSERTLLSSTEVCLNSLRANSIYKSQPAETSACSALRLAASPVSIEMHIHVLKNGEVL